MIRTDHNHTSTPHCPVTQTLSESDRGRIEKRVEQATKDSQRFERVEVTRDEALAMFTENKFKVRACMRKCMTSTASINVDQHVSIILLTHHTCALLLLTYHTRKPAVCVVLRKQTAKHGCCTQVCCTSSLVTLARTPAACLALQKVAKHKFDPGVQDQIQVKKDIRYWSRQRSHCHSYAASDNITNVTSRSTHHITVANTITHSPTY